MTALNEIMFGVGMFCIGISAASFYWSFQLKKLADQSKATFDKIRRDTDAAFAKLKRELEVEAQRERDQSK